MRLLRFRPGVEDDEIIGFLQVVARARLLAGDAADDPLTLLWEQEFVSIDYQFVESFEEGGPALDPQSIGGSALPETAAAATQAKLATEGAGGGRPGGA